MGILIPEEAPEFEIFMRTSQLNEGKPTIDDKEEEEELNK